MLRLLCCSYYSVANAYYYHISDNFIVDSFIIDNVFKYNVFDDSVFIDTVISETVIPHYLFVIIDNVYNTGHQSESV